jgi:signal transduction histidine kinase/DNA-binding response OmpR family regulator
MMAMAQERILIAENDLAVQDFIGRQTLQAAGYQVLFAPDAAAVLKEAADLPFDVIVADLSLPDLSGKDLLVALAAQGVTTPVVLLAHKGMEGELVQSFRLGAADFIFWPAREAEILSAVERILKQTHERQDRDQLTTELLQSNDGLQAQIDELRRISEMGQTLVRMTDPATLNDRVLEQAVRLGRADLGWFLLRDEPSKAFLLEARYKLPAALPVRIHQPWDDGISSLVAASGDSLSLVGEPLKRFKTASLGQSILVMPVKVNHKVAGLLALMRKKLEAFDETDQRLVGAVAEYAAIALANARVVRGLEERARAQQAAAENAAAGEKVANELLLRAKKELNSKIAFQREALTAFVAELGGALTPSQQEKLALLETAIKNLDIITEAITPVQLTKTQRASRFVNLNDTLRQIEVHFLPLAQENDLTLRLSIPEQDVYIQADQAQIQQALQGLVSNAIKFCNPTGQIHIQLEKLSDHDVHLTVGNTGRGVESRTINKLFNGEADSEPAHPLRFGGLGVGMGLIKEIVSRQNGKIWAESKPENGAVFHLTFPAAR